MRRRHHFYRFLLGPTQVGATLSLAFRAVGGTKSDAIGMEVVL